MRRAFTLIELMVVAGIMAFLGTAAVGGYNAFQRGMSERGAAGVASALFKAAKERALVDRSPTMVICYNRLIREAAGDDQNAIVVGEAVAIRRSGRITYAGTDVLVDEFADILGSYDVVDGDDIKERGGIRLWQFDDAKMSEAKYSVIADAAMPFDPGSSYLQTYEGWANGETSDNNADVKLSTKTPESDGRHVTTKSGGMESLVYAFHVLDRGTASWKIGTGYGFEFARVQLPHNFAFDGTLPTRLDELKLIKILYFDPESVSDQSLNIIFCQADGSGQPKSDHVAGTATSKGLEEGK